MSRNKDNMLMMVYGLYLTKSYLYISSLILLHVTEVISTANLPKNYFWTTNLKINPSIPRNHTPLDKPHEQTGKKQIRLFYIRTFIDEMADACLTTDFLWYNTFFFSFRRSSSKIWHTDGLFFFGDHLYISQLHQHETNINCFFFFWNYIK